MRPAFIHVSIGPGSSLCARDVFSLAITTILIPVLTSTHESTLSWSNPLNMEIPILRDLLIIAGLAVIVLTASYHLRIPGVVGLLFAGLVIGPHGLGLMNTTDEVE